MEHRYETLIVNDGGLEGVVLANSGWQSKVASVSKADFEHTNPEQLIGAAWATCLNATIRSILKAKNLENKSRVEVTVHLWFEEKTRYHFTLDACASIEHLSIEDAEKIVHTADRFCPVSKLLKNAEGVTLKTIPYI